MSCIVRLRKSVLILLGSMVTLFASATTDPVQVTVFSGKDGELVPNAVRETVDMKFYDPYWGTRIPHPEADIIENVIALRVDEHSSKIIQENFTFKVNFNIDYTVLNGQTYSMANQELTVTYVKGQGAKYDVRSYMVFDNARKVKVTINTAAIVGTNTINVAEFIIMENRMTVKRDYTFDPLAKALNISHTAPQTTASNVSDQLPLSWTDDETTGRTHYDLEWAWVDYTALSRFMTSGNFDQNLIFPNNSTRVTIAATDHYNVPLLYDGNGYLFYRIRPVQYSEDGVTIKNGAWATSTASAPSPVPFFEYQGGYEPELNWQATTTYAEEGKRKSVIQYFDGSMRSRQTVTKDNTTDTTIVAETLYDYQGRPAINILPAPTLGNIMEFAKNFNRFQASTYQKDIYDLIPSGDEICDVKPSILDSVSGASKYYSANNALVNEGYHKYIPSAFGFPYTETRYTPDATGRIAAQGGVGPTFQLNTGKETKYYYGTADQKELDALFGTEVGEAMHYSKNMVTDANGQYSVSYVDMHGRTIATALAGTPPANLDALPSYQTRYMTKNLLAEGRNTRTDRGIVSSNTILVTKEGPHQFHYELGPQSAEILACNPANETVCYDCYYDLEIRITSDCMDPIVITRKNFNFKSTDVEFTGYDISCSTTPGSLVVDETYMLKEGEYNIVKTLTLSRDAQNWYKNNVFNIRNICKTLQDFYNEQYSVMISQSDCNVTYDCQSCLANLGEYADFKANFLASQGITDPNATVEYEREILASYAEALKVCKDLCPAPENKLDFMKNMLMGDLIPESGQYALLDEDLNENGVLTDFVTTPEGKRIYEMNTNRIYNIFNTRALSTIRPFTTPMSIDGAPLTGGYLTNELPDQDLTPNPPSGVTDVDFKQFASSFKEHWAEYLLYYHPEYPKYKYAKDNLTHSYNFDVDVEAIETWDAAAANSGYYTSALLNNDPFFKTGGLGASKIYKDPSDPQNNGKTYRQVMLDYLTVNYAKSNKSMWQLAWMAVNCRENDPSCGNGIPATPPYTNANCPGDLNLVWRMFRTLFLTEKDRMLNLLLDAETVNQISYDEIRRNYYERRFVSPKDVSALDLGTANNIANAPNPGQASIDQTSAELAAIYGATCDSYIEMWTSKLAECDQLNALAANVRANIINEIMLGLKSVCVRGSDEDHPNGSSTVKPTDTGTPSSFEQVIRDVFQRHDIDPSAVCSPFAINYPLPYEKQPAISDEVIINTKDDCLCSRIQQLQAEKSQIGYSGTFSEFLKYQHNVEISQTLLQTLIDGCSSTSTEDCKFYDPPITVPAIFSCGTTLSNCIECLEYEKLKKEFVTTYAPGFVINPSPQENEAALNANLYFQQFMNSRTGLGKNWFDYLAFEQACNAYMDSWSCGRLDSIITAYNQSVTTPLYGAACRNAFTVYFNQAFGTAYTYAQIQSLFMKYCGHLPDLCQVELTCTGFKNVIDSFYHRYGTGIRIAGNCQTLFAAHFNDMFETDYTFAQLQQLYNGLCGGELDVCSQFDCSKLKAVLDSWNSCHRADQLDPDCEGQWATYFNGMMSTGLSIRQIDSLYAACGLPLNPCTPPVTCKMLNSLLFSYNNMGNAACAGSGLDSLSSTYCTDCFVWYVNDKLGTSYNYTQLQALYMTNCGTKLDMCDQRLDCKKLTDFVNGYLATNRSLPPASNNCDSLFSAAFNQHFGDSLNYAQIMALYQQYCGKQPVICKTAVIMTCAEMTDVYQEFVRLYPQPSSYFGANCQTAFVNYFNQYFGDTLTWYDIQTYYLTQCGSIPPICTPTDSCTQVSQFLNSYNARYSSFILPKEVCVDLFTRQYNKAFTSKVQYNWKDVERLYNNCGVTIPVCDQPGGSFDATRVNNARAAFYAYYEDALPANPDKVMAEFFNQYYGTSFTDYAQLDQWAKDNFSVDLHMVSGNEPALKSQRLRARSADLPPAPSTLPPRLCGTSTLFPNIVVVTPDPCDDVENMALVAATELYSNYVQQQYDEFDKNYQEKCLTGPVQEVFTMRSQLAEYHYTLYYYDQAGNLVKTVPPKGVDESHLGEPAVDTWHASVNAARIAGTTLAVEHTMTTNYRYNTLNQVVAQESPDGGKSLFWYDALGRLVLSQNAKQRPGKYSYTKYDALGRITEVGQLTGSDVNQALTQHLGDLATWFTGVDLTREQITKTVYDEPSDLSPSVIDQRHMRNRVSYAYVQPNASFSSNGVPYHNGTFYSYDIHGNVDKLVQHYNFGVMESNAGNAFKKMEYEYDLVSGKVNKVSYQKGVPDQFFHRYEYDAENKLKEVYTSPDNVYWERQARYDYYLHGPLARTELGELRVQGLDYAYTLQGWLKGVNSSTIGSGWDIGEDGKTKNHPAKDVFSFSLNYFNSDYLAVNSNSFPFAGVSNGLVNISGDAVETGKNLFNGNINSMMVNIPTLGDSKLYGYRYDQLNRLKAMNSYTGLDATVNTFYPLASQDYKERITYDANGNIMHYLRNAYTANQLAMDDLSYDYKTTNNQLRKVSDAVTSTPAGYSDIPNDQINDNYVYDAIGNLVCDHQEGMFDPNAPGKEMIEWTVYGKIHKTTKIKSGVTTVIEYSYDAGGSRIGKSVKVGTGASKTTWYVRDATGNTMSVYTDQDAAINSSRLSQTEVYLFGSSRLGLWTPLRDVGISDWAYFDYDYFPGVTGGALRSSWRRGSQEYEMSNHLGNVLATISDNRLPEESNLPGDVGLIGHFLADVLSTRDYYPFGMIMPGRTNGDYRYGFNGKENDNEVKGEGNQQDYGMRIYDPRLGKFLSVDPLAKSYPWYTPYQFAGNKPIAFIDRDGLEEASPMERNQAISYFENSIKPYISKYASSRAFANMNPQSFLTQLGEALKNPSSLKERYNVGNMCGVYAFSYVFALYKPSEFARGAADLFITGTGHDVGGLDVVPDNGLKNAGNNTGNSLPTLVFGGSMRSHYNQFLNFGGDAKKYFGSTNSSTMIAWLEDRLGVEVKQFSYGHEYFLDGITDNDLKTLSNHVNSGKQAVIRINAGQFQKGSKATTFDPEGDASGGDHWVVLNGKMNIDETKKTVTVDVFDIHRGLEPRTFSTKVFKDMINHVLMISQKDEKKE
ncbi:RHS repeat-associated core domain-containing protein [Terrimonas sp. NA20]|uniref:RHS repeat-associated core domain-containing protein n=1 Tax=Terrimonas ginsenosidimutans TaxID=2908004 RepID=A0ABS9KN41_9BACT|nr:RHS repeat-associated core domain-containing protein [Terrimonas ginsenosidimutans]MCG2613738.1 RHS repeat-associated core domain-containing protein [Terrimonas ginsenosidimutans]